MLAEQFTRIGFIEVKVTGSGEMRQMEGLWQGPDITSMLDAHLSVIQEVF
jgi:hypothetical protein